MVKKGCRSGQFLHLFVVFFLGLQASSSFVSSDLDDGAEEEGIWERVQLLERQVLVFL